MDLHKVTQPPPEPGTPQRYSSGVQPPFTSTAVINTILELSSNVRRHLYNVFFDHIQPVFPVVSLATLERFSASPLLDAAILGTAAHHHSAIASHRDLGHIQNVIACELKKLCNLDGEYQPTIQTIQALLLISNKVELSTRGHGDIMSIPLRLGLLCQMAADLGINRQAPLQTDDRALYAVLWKACLFQDALLCAVFGQPLNIPETPQVTLKMHPGVAPRLELSFFDAAVEASHCLRHVLRAVYSSKQYNEDLVADCRHVLEQLRCYHRELDLMRQVCSDYEYRTLGMLHHNNRLLFVLGLASSTQRSSEKPELSEFMTQEAIHVIPEACQTLQWFSIDFYLSMACRLENLLYCASRASMLIVDVLRDCPRTQNQSGQLVGNLQSALAAARTLKDFLIKDNSWGSHWAQGHTLEAILARLDGEDLRTVHMNPELKRIIGHQFPAQAADQLAMLGTGSTSVVHDYWLDEDLLNNVLFNSTDWNAVLMEWDERSFWPASEVDLQFDERGFPMGRSDLPSVANDLYEPTVRHDAADGL